MDLTIQNIQNQILLAYQYVTHKIGILAGHTVQVFHKGMAYVNQGVGYLQQDARIAAPAMIIGNVLLFEIAIRITDFVDKKVLPSEKRVESKGNYSQPTPHASIRDLLLLTVFSVIVICPNVAASKWLKPKLSPVAMTALIITSIAGDIMVRYLTYGKNIFGRS